MSQFHRRSFFLFVVTLSLPLFAICSPIFEEKGNQSDMASILRKYNTFVLRNPLIAMSLTTGTTMGLGNLISQTAVEKRKLNDIDWPRLAKFAAAGYFFSGPFLRYWFYGLEKYFHGSKFGPVKMMITDQLIASPFLHAALFLYLPLANGKSWTEAKEHMNDRLPTVMKVNYTVWPAIQLINFYFVPLQHRVLFVNICVVIWSTFLAYMTKH